MGRGAGWGRGGGCEEGDTTLLNNCSASQIKNSKASIEGTRILSAWKKFILSAIKGTKRRRRYSPLKIAELLYKKKIKITGVLVKKKKINNNNKNIKYKASLEGRRILLCGHGRNSL